MNTKKNRKNNKKIGVNVLEHVIIESKSICVHDYIKDFGITRCSKCDFKSILYLTPLKKQE